MPRLGGLRPPEPRHSQRLPSGEMRNTDASRSARAGELFSVMCSRFVRPAPFPAIR